MATASRFGRNARSPFETKKLAALAGIEPASPDRQSVILAVER